jgi:hypothetical protein
MPDWREDKIIDLVLVVLRRGVGMGRVVGRMRRALCDAKCCSQKKSEID